MIIKEKIGNLNSFDTGDRVVERVAIEWYEANKRILHKTTQSGREVVLKFMNETQNLTDDDVLWYDETTVVIADIQPCEAIIIKPQTMLQIAAVCYEIGNKHLPLFYYKDELLVPFDEPLFKLLVAGGHQPIKENRKLLNQFKTTVLPHANIENKPTIFSKILQLTTSSSSDAK